MTGFRRLGIRSTFAMMMALAAQTAAAQWQPQWSTLWQHPESFTSVSPLRLRVASDGSIYAAANVTHHSVSHVALMRFDANGSFVWLQERQASTVAGIAFVGVDRVAIAGDGGGTETPVDIRLYDTKSGALIWARQAGDGHVLNGAIYDTSQLVVDAGGNMMVLASDLGDYVVIRFDADGNPLPTWRFEAETDSNVFATGIVALPDGGAIITGRGQSFDGNVTVRLDANGNNVFTDIENSGPHPFGAGYLGVNNDGEVFVAAARENSIGSPQARVWKLSSKGIRLWTSILPNPGAPTSGTSIGGFALAANGDPLIAVDAGAGALFRLVRLNGATGGVIADTQAPIGGAPSTLKLAENGRVLIGGNGPVGGGHVSGRIAEFAANGQACRASGNIGIFSALNADAGTSGWHVLGATSFVQGVGNDAFVSQFDADGNCTLTDTVFADGFESDAP